MLWSLHGAFGDASDWNDLAARLAERVRGARAARVHALDLWSGGDDLPLVAWARHLNETATATDEAPLLLGYSMGGRLALHALVAEASPWRGAVVVSAHPGLSDDDARGARRAHDDRWLAKLDSLSWHAFGAQWNSQAVLRAEEGAPARPLPAFRPAMRRGLGVWSLAEQGDLREPLARVRVPVLWVTGERDARFTGLAERAAAVMPRARHLVLPDCGHRVPWEAPQTFADAVAAFVASPHQT